MKVIKWIDKYLEEVLMTLLLIAIAVIMMLQVISRYVFGSALTWSDELARYFLLWCGFLSVSYCVKRRISIKIEQVQNFVPERYRGWMKLVRHTIVFAFCIIMIPYAVTYVVQTVQNGAISPAMRIPLYYVQSAPLVCFVLLALRVAQAWIRELRNSIRVLQGKQEPESGPETLPEEVLVIEAEKKKAKEGVEK